MKSLAPSLLAAAILSAGAVTPVVATTIELVTNTYTVTTQGSLSSNTLEISGPGTLTVSMTDLQWPTPLAPNTMSFSLQNGAGAAVGSFANGGTDTFDITQAGTFYALAYAQAQPLPGLSIGYGSYGLQIGYTPDVVLPPSAALLASALVMIGGSAWRRRRVAGAAEVRGSAEPVLS
jgi:hypothetical protein